MRHAGNVEESPLSSRSDFSLLYFLLYCLLSRRDSLDCNLLTDLKSFDFTQSDLLNKLIVE